MPLIDDVKTISSLTWNTPTAVIDEFFQNFESKDNQFQDAFLLELSTHYDLFFYYCGLCLQYNSHKQKLTPFLNSIQDINAMLDIYLIMTLRNDALRFDYVEKIKSSFSSPNHVVNEKKESLLIFLLDNPNLFETLSIPFSEDSRYYNSEIRFGSKKIEFKTEIEDDYKKTPHHVIHIPARFLKFGNKNYQKIHLHYVYNKATSSSNIYDSKNRDHIIRNFFFDDTNLLTFEFDGINPISLFRTADDLIRSIGHGECPSPFLSTFTNSKMDFTKKLEFLEKVCSITSNNQYFDTYSIASRLYFDTAFLSKELNGIENFDFSSHPNYSKIVITQILDNFTLQHSNFRYNDRASAISYDRNNSKNIQFKSTYNPLNNGVLSSDILSARIAIRNFKLLFKKILPFLTTNDNKIDYFTEIVSVYIKTRPTKKQFFATLSTLFGDYEPIFEPIDSRIFNTISKTNALIIEAMANIGVYSTYFIEYFCQKGEFLKATSLISKTKPVYSRHNSLSSLKTDLKEFLSKKNNYPDENPPAPQFHELFTLYPQLFHFASNYQVTQIISYELSLKIPNFSLDLLIYHSKKMKLTYKDLINILNHKHRDQFLPSFNLDDITDNFIKHFSEFPPNHQEYIFSLMTKNLLSLLSSSQIISYMVAKDRWSSEQTVNNQRLFIEFLIKHEGNLELFESIIEVAKFFKLELSDVIEQDFYYLIDGSLDGLFS